MKIGKTLTLILIASMLLGIAMYGPVGAQDTTIGVEPTETVSDSTFTVEIWIRDVADLAGYEFKLGYDTAVLTATSVTYGGIFGGTYFELGNTINDAEGWVSYGCMEMFGEPAFTGDDIAATVTFDVDSQGESDLDLYDTDLGDDMAMPIVHTALDGHFIHPLWPPQVSLWAKIINAKEKWMALGDIQTIKGLITNEGVEGAYVRATFVLVDAATHTPEEFLMSDELWIGPGESRWVTNDDWRATADKMGTYYVTGFIQFSADGINWPDYTMYESELGGMGTFKDKIGPSWFKAATYGK